MGGKGDGAQQNLHLLRMTSLIHLRKDLPFGFRRLYYCNLDYPVSGHHHHYYLMMGLLIPKQEYDRLNN